MRLEETAHHLVRVLGPDGNSLVWKQASDLSKDDHVVVSEEETQ